MPSKVSNEVRNVYNSVHRDGRLCDTLKGFS